MRVGLVDEGRPLHIVPAVPVSEVEETWGPSSPALKGAGLAGAVMPNRSCERTRTCARDELCVCVHVCVRT